MASQTILKCTKTFMKFSQVTIQIQRTLISSSKFEKSVTSTLISSTQLTVVSFLIINLQRLTTACSVIRNNKTNLKLKLQPIIKLYSERFTNPKKTKTKSKLLKTRLKIHQVIKIYNIKISCFSGSPKIKRMTLLLLSNAFRTNKTGMNCRMVQILRILGI